jgi:hypothetical protein
MRMGLQCRGSDCDVLEHLHFELRCTHLSLDRSEWVLNRLASERNFFEVVVEPLLHSLRDGLVSPAFDAAPG